MSNIAVETLLKQRQQLLDERQKMWERYAKEIDDIDVAIEAINGKKSHETTSEFHYDDEHPDYIKQSQEEI